MKQIASAEDEVGKMAEKEDAVIIPKSLIMKGEHKIESNLNRII